MNITASKLYDFMQCPHRVWRDIYGSKEEKIQETNPFLQLLWDRGTSYEYKIISQLDEYLDLSEDGSLEERFKKTIEAMNSKVPLIYQGVLMVDNIVGIPDLLRIDGDDNYIPIDIKSGKGMDGEDDSSGKEGKPKKHYAVQLALYCDALNRLGFKNNKKGIIFDINAEETIYNLEDQIGARTIGSFWDLYKNVFNQVVMLTESTQKNNPVIGSECNFCQWHDSCSNWVIQNDDPTGLFSLGRGKRDVLREDIGVETIQDILDLDIKSLMDRKKADKSFLKGIGPSTIEKIIVRANVSKIIQKPVVYGSVVFPEVTHELFFDIEDDPTRDFVYLHGVYERSPAGEKFFPFVAEKITEDAEKKAWSDFWEYIRRLPKDNYSVYYYSSYEKTAYRRMQKKYPDIISEVELEAFFKNPNVIDLYTSVVLKKTDWPVARYSLKALAQYLGFSWRDKTPSGALSIQWFNEYIETKDKEKLNRILLYNEDDCKATMVLKDAITDLYNNK